MRASRKILLCTVPSVLCTAFKIGEPGGIRTHDSRLKRAVLYQLSYRPALAVFFKDAYSNKYLQLLSTEFMFQFFFVCFLNGCSRIIVSSLRGPVEMIVGLTPHSLQSFST
jgi:hypothetical protein